MTFEGAGTASHLGKVTLNGSQCVDPFGSAQSPLAVSNAIWNLTAANGDELYFAGGGQIIPTASPLVFKVDGLYAITGGAGRFIHAEGGGKIGGWVAFTHFPPMPGDPGPKVHHTYEGTLAY